jgi:hypothetical protein
MKDVYNAQVTNQRLAGVQFLLMKFPQLAGANVLTWRTTGHGLGRIFN